MGALRYVDFPDYKAIFFRRSFPEIQDLIDRARILYQKAYPECKWKEAKHRFEFPGGGIIMFSHMEREIDSEAHTGKEYQYIAFEELTHFLFKQYSDLLTCNRSANSKIKPVTVATTNPGGIGHLWVKNYFVDPAKPGTTIVNPRTGRTRVFIPATVYDNPTLIKNDPGYVKILKSITDIRKRKMQLEGDWNIPPNQALAEWNPEIHVVSQRDLGQNSTKFISIDWAYGRPFSIGWYEVDNYDRLYCYREWYGVKYDEFGAVIPDVGIEMDAFLVAQGVKQRTHEKIEYIIADPHIWDKEGHGGNIADDFMKVLQWPLIKANNDRISGKNQVHARLRVRVDGKPGVTFSENCIHAIRTLPGLPIDKSMEDVNTKSEDHWYDQFRYACMSQPTTEIVVEGREGYKGLTSIEPFRFAKPRDIEGNIIEEQEYGIAGSYG